MGAESRDARRLSSANAVVLLRPGDDLGRALKKFKDACAEAEVPRELKKRDHYVKPGEARRLKSRRAQKRAARLAKRRLEREALIVGRYGRT